MNGFPTVAVAALLASMVASLHAQGYGNGQDGALAPTSDVTLDTTNRVFQFTTIMIPAGVTVHLVGGDPAQMLCIGSATIHGRIEADGHGQSPGPGGYRGGATVWYSPGAGSTGENGQGPGGGAGGNAPVLGVAPGGPGAHATQGNGSAPVYGAPLPFDLRGGSGGGGGLCYASMSNCGPSGGGGGGAVALLAGGPVVVTGSITARGGSHAPSGATGTGGAGSGGAILIRSLQCVRVQGTLDAVGGQQIAGLWFLQGGDGFIRIDGYSACGAPDLTGATITPAPFVASLPFLTALAPARIGQVHPARCAAAPGDVLGWYVSPGTTMLPLPPFGTLELDPNAGIFFLGQFAVPTTGHDPLAVADVMIPNAPQLIGLSLYSQMFNAFGTVTGQPRLSNRLVTRIGS
jgi:hypothetical protein